MEDLDIDRSRLTDLTKSVLSYYQNVQIELAHRLYSDVQYFLYSFSDDQISEASPEETQVLI